MTLQNDLIKKFYKEIKGEITIIGVAEAELAINCICIILLWVEFNLPFQPIQPILLAMQI